METKKLPSEIKLCLFDIIDDDLNDRIFEAIQDHLCKTYGNGCYSFDITSEKLEIKHIEKESDY